MNDHLPDKTYLGALCKRGHDWQETGQSLRYASDRGCVRCRAEQGREYFLSEQGREICRAASNRYNHTDKRKEWNKQFAASERGKESSRRAQLAYRQTENGKQKRREAEIRYAKTEKRRISWKRKYARRRALIASNHIPYTDDDVATIAEKFDFACAYCGSRRNLTLDHVVAVSRGGADALANIVPACFSCNSSKQSSDAFAWYREKTFFDLERWKKIEGHVAPLS